MKKTVKIYEYKNCSTCKSALKYLDAKGITYEKHPIVEQPPTPAELRQMLSHIKSEGQTFKKLFNTSGELYRELKISEKIEAGMTEAEAIQLLSKNGKLIKRPFLLTSKGGITGFKPDAWDRLLQNI